MRNHRRFGRGSCVTFMRVRNRVLQTLIHSFLCVRTHIQGLDGDDAWRGLLIQDAQRCDLGSINLPGRLVPLAIDLLLRRLQRALAE